MKKFVNGFIWIFRAIGFTIKVLAIDFYYWLTGEYIEDEKLVKWLIELIALIDSSPFKLPKKQINAMHELIWEYNTYCNSFV